MKRILAAITAASISLAAGAAFAGAEVSETSHKTIRAEWAKSQAVGGYGFPLTAIPVAIADLLTGKSSQRQITQTQKGSATGN